MKFNIYGKFNIFFKVLFFLISFAICAFIFCMSAQTATKSSEVSGGLIFKLSEILISDFKYKDLISQQAIVESLQFIIRKSAHFLIYAALGLNLCGFVSTFKVGFRKLFFIPFFACVLYAISDEVHQLYVMGRSCELRDVIIDSSGAVLGIFVFILILKIIIRMLSNKSGEWEKGDFSVRKRVLLANNKLLEEKLIEANSVIEALNEEIGLLKDEISLLSKAKKAEVEDLCKDENIKDEEQENACCEPPVENGFVVKDCFDDTGLNSLFSTTTADCDDTEEYAVSLVAKIILECTKAELRVSSSNLASAADDKNFILGEAETAKQRIFEILEENKQDADKKSLLDGVVKSYSQKIINVLSKY